MSYSLDDKIMFIVTIAIIMSLMLSGCNVQGQDQVHTQNETIQITTEDNSSIRQPIIKNDSELYDNNTNQAIG